ncbi:ferredoxin--NADP reductase [Gordonia hankookensis]|uniref:Ferredoxin--NADP reductase n=1 Tax=Gordonia hankookensis TaxID=589403 RepID=A0ABR7WA56_9ACTN|nr:ferredoxin--NADP reductase [Gordonia hankookensis]MBD1319638.1 ferredoxin--NADP reductase [Gordonia hankookensis]
MTTVAAGVAPPRPASARVARVIDETRDAKSIVFEVPSHRAHDFIYRPGQFLTLRIPSDTTGSVARCYSLASCPVSDDELMVTVKRTEDGYGSNWLCDNVSEGDIVDLLPPSGVFTPASVHEDLLLWGAGGGITPLFSILKSTLATGSGHVTLIYANRDADSIIFDGRLRDLAARHPNRLVVIHWLESVRGQPTADELARLAEPFADRHSFMCGPAGFMATVRDAMAGLGVPRSRVHAEVFASLRGDPFAESASEPTAESDPLAATDAATAQVVSDGNTHTIDWPRSQNLVEAMLAHGIDVPYSCREGQCGTCACVVVDGDVTMTDTGVLDEDDLEAGYVLACQARPHSDFARIRF